MHESEMKNNKDISSEIKIKCYSRITDTPKARSKSSDWPIVRDRRISAKKQKRIWLPNQNAMMNIICSNQWTTHGKSPFIINDNTARNERKSLDLVMWIELNQAILLPRLSDLLRNSTIHFRMFLYLVTCFPSHDFVAMPVISTNNFVSTIFPHLISEGRPNCSRLWPA